MTGTTGTADAPDACAAGRHDFYRDGQAWQCRSCPERRPYGPNGGAS